ncbi:spermidine/putrescine import ATP-binding protein PotA [Clostridium acetireducens DSM 10703]|jgi:spermidine/putrescine ABC transporter ATP-binding subunit|uniref:Spermidine/putrescine import ATP-binding protein PotA n=1 Tax=Clostridium acetireducens DSM 10703 TaxID=1121290 RepID=A0A1E8EW62_9CLOT|nr:ABC transporter ATP-binding protein [Clostridium acetireducens]OFI01470.1 spermidine/putrescine import ATP-binding protein PotA [Clostridium acetireducens DSM 10703]
MYYLNIKNLTKKYGENTVLNNINLQVEKGNFISLLGPSGCGKTTTLRLIAGFEDADYGEVIVDGEKINELPVYKRNIGMVFQSYALFPHMNVEQNIAYGLEQRKISKQEIKKRVEEIIEMVQLKGFEKRKPKQLSGGQQQRVALARALIIKPRLLLLDESLSALDKKLRVEMQIELKQIQKKIGITTIFVTHDQEEALTMSDKVAVMYKGEIIQIDTPENIYEYPKTSFVADFLGQANFFRGKVISKQNELYEILLDNNKKFKFESTKPVEIGDNIILTIRPEKMNIHKEKPENTHFIKGKIEFVTYAGDNSLYRIKSLDKEVKVQKQNFKRDFSYNIGDEVYISWDKKSSLILYK